MLLLPLLNSLMMVVVVLVVVIIERRGREETTVRRRRRVKTVRLVGQRAETDIDVGQKRAKTFLPIF
jgi:hypothetical protein